MRLFVKFDINTALTKILQEQLEKHNLQFDVIGMSEVEINSTITPETMHALSADLNDYGIQIVENFKTIQVQKIKDAIRDMVYTDSTAPNLKNSDYLADKLKLSYSYIFNLFSEVTYTSIENYIIIQKIERAKEFIITNQLTFSEIAFRLNYSSVAHFSTQFKNVTGLTPSAFQRIINKRRAVKGE